MRYISIIFMVVVVVSGMVVIASRAGESSAPRAHCEFGRVQGFVGIQDKPVYLVGTIPSRFTADQRYFKRRYNCLHRRAAVRRVDLGVYDVRFGGLPYKMALVTGVSYDGVSASVVEISPSVYRVSLRGPLVDPRSLLLIGRDVAFNIAIF